MKSLLFILFLTPIFLFGQIDKDLNTLQNKILDQEKENQKRQRIDSLLQNGNGKIIEYGTRIYGYPFNDFDTTIYNKITVIQEFESNKKNGKRIQFFKYPADTASVEYYKNDFMEGPFYYNHKNGKIWKKGFNRGGKSVGQVELWTEDGHKVEKNLEYKEIDGLIYLNGQLCNGKRIIVGHSGLNDGKVLNALYFTHGRIDSLYSYNTNLK